MLLILSRLRWRAVPRPRPSCRPRRAATSAAAARATAAAVVVVRAASEAQQRRVAQSSKQPSSKQPARSSLGVSSTARAHPLTRPAAPAPPQLVAAAPSPWGSPSRALVRPPRATSPHRQIHAQRLAIFGRLARLRRHRPAPHLLQVVLAREEEPRRTRFGAGASSSTKSSTSLPTFTAIEDERDESRTASS